MPGMIKEHLTRDQTANATAAEVQRGKQFFLQAQQRMAKWASTHCFTKLIETVLTLLLTYTNTHIFAQFVLTVCSNNVKSEQNNEEHLCHWGYQEKKKFGRHLSVFLPPTDHLSKAVTQRGCTGPFTPRFQLKNTHFQVLPYSKYLLTAPFV